MMKYSAIAVTCVALLITGCAILTNDPQMEPIRTFNPATDAKVKIYHDGNVYMYLYPNQTPEKLPHKESILGETISKKTAYKHANNHIESTRSFPEYLSAYGKIASTDNYTVMAGQPLTLEGWLAESDSGYPYFTPEFAGCSAVYATLTPKAGHNYAAYMLYIGGNYKTCAYVQVIELKNEAGVIKYLPVSNVSRVSIQELFK